MESMRKIKLMVTIFMVLLPIVNQYDLFPLMVMDVFAFLGVVAYFWGGERVVGVKPAVFWFVAYLVIDTLLISLLIDGVSSVGVYIRMCRIVVIYVFFFLVVPNLFDFDIGFQFYTKVVYLVSAVAIIQFVSFYAFKTDINLLIPGLKINYGNNLTSDLLMRKWHDNASVGFYRPCSFFFEPAHHAQYCLLWLAIALAYNPSNHEKRWMYGMVLVSFGLITTTSSLGVVGCALLWMFDIASNLNKSNKSGRIFAILPFFLIMIVFVISQNSINQQLAGKAASLASGESASTSLRLFRGIACFNQMDILYKFFGCGYGNIGLFLQEHDIRTIYDYGVTITDYMNGASTILCSLGFVGLISYIYMMLDISVINKFGTRKALFLVLMIVMMSSAIFGSPTYFLLTTFMQTKSRRCCRYTLFEQRNVECIK